MTKKLTCIALAAIFATCLTAQNIAVDTDNCIGKIRQVNGGNLGPNLYAEDSGYSIRKEFADLHIPITRLHDVSLLEKGLRIVDVDLIFPNFHADENDPRNYCFEPTDDYIQHCLDAGTKIFYRLGVSIDHSIKKYRTTPPPDSAKWARICCKIIEHYNEGWANGFHHNIEYWEIWNEPDCKNPSGRNPMWAGTEEQFNKFYCDAAKIIKKRFPNIKVGGPAHTCFSKETINFLKECKKTGAPLDFYSWHMYSGNVETFIKDPQIVKNELVKQGFPDAELHFNEWHYFPIKWSQLRAKDGKKDAGYERLHDAENGVANNAVMTGWQDTPLTCGYYYTTGLGSWGIFDNFARPVKTYSAYKAFGELAKFFPNRLAAKSSSKGIYVLAGKNNDGKIRILVSALKPESKTITMKISNANLSEAKVFIYDSSHDFAETKDFSVTNGILSIPVTDDFTNILVNL